MLEIVREAMSTLDRLHEYVGLFQSVFRRREQVRWAGVYAQGLLQEGDRKSVEVIASRVELPADLAVEDAAQALQHFVSHSPWEAEDLARRYREVVARPLAVADGVFVIEDVAFVKQGRHSVGVQRQFSSAHGRKINCQLAVSLYHAGPTGAIPLALRLYLPRSWVQSAARLEASGVPQAFRRPASRAEIALDLLDGVRAEGFPGPMVLAGAPYGASREFQTGLEGRGLSFLLEAPEDSDAPAEPRRLLEESGRPVLSNLPVETPAERVRELWDRRRRAEEVGRRLRVELGLDHFEGRSWPGFHHHASLVLMAYGFRLWPGAAGALE